MDKYELYIYHNNSIYLVFNFKTYDNFSAEAKAKRMFNMMEFKLGILYNQKGKEILKLKK